MPRAICNPSTGERIVITTSGEDSHGTLLAFDLFLPPGGHVPGRHAHPRQEERFSVLAGELEFRLDGRTIRLRPGETVVVRAGAAHWFGNRSAFDAHARVEVRPALRMQELLSTSERIATTHGRWSVLPRVADLARMLVEFEAELIVPLVPRRLVRAAAALLARA